MNHTKTVSCKEIKDHMAEILNRVAYNHNRYKIARHNKEMAIIISIDEWQVIENILQKLEDEQDMHEGLLALEEVKKQGSISFDKMKKRMGL
ncbi:MAG TPA: type II toxin-antitoxin system Phd/YefM family antitoxin [Parachlamydiaceae bacterium]|nr:type II toxin-antitoxin system Phd/YefM family antitoxin [Parachlamydiaceae bacterium]